MPDERLRIKIEADAKQAERDLENIAELGDELTDDALTLLVDAKTEGAQAEIKRLSKLLQSADDPVDIKVITTGIAQARTQIEQLNGAIDKVDRNDIDIDADTSGVSGLRGALDSAGGAAEGLVSELGPIGSILGSASAGPAAAAVAVATGLFAAADSAADTATEVKQISDLLGGSVEDASRLRGAFAATGIEASDLMDIVLQTTGALDAQPALVKELGIEMGGSPIDNFVAAADAVDNVDDATRRAIISSQLFGEEGVRQLQQLKSQYGSVSAAIEAVPELAVLGEDDIDNAITYQKEMAELKAKFAALAGELGQKVLPVVTEIVDTLNGLDEGSWGDFFSGLGRNISNAAGWLTEGFVGQFLTGEIDKARGTTEADAANLGAFIGDTFAAGMRTTAGSIATEATAAFNNIDTGGLEGAALLGEQAMGGLEVGIDDVTLSVEEQKAAFEKALGPLKAFNDRVQDNVASLEEQAAAHRDAAAAAEEQLGVFKTHAEAVIDRIDAEAELAATLADSASTWQEQRDDVLAVAAARVEEMRLAQLSQGVTMTQTEQLDNMNWELLNLAGTLDGPARQAILDHIATLNGIPPDKMTAISAAIEAGDYDTAAGLLAELSAPRDVAVTADAETKQAKKDLLDVSSAEYLAYMELGAVTRPAERQVDGFVGATEAKNPKVKVGADDSKGRTKVSDFVSDIDGTAAALTVLARDSDLDDAKTKADNLDGRTVYVNIAARGLTEFTTNVRNAINGALGGGRTQQSVAARYVFRNGHYVEINP